MILDVFAGPGGWSEGLRLHGLHDVGVELDPWACQTRSAAGHLTIQADAAKFPVPRPGIVDGLILSPPCPTFSTAGQGAGRDEMPALIEAVTRWAMHGWVDPWALCEWADPRTALVLEPLRYMACDPEFLLLEQVPPVLPLWQRMAEVLRDKGWSTWAGVLCAADYGVPQTRRRAFLIASRTRTVHPPEPTHAEHPEVGLFGELEPWVSMADALGWDGGRHYYVDRRQTGAPVVDVLERPAPTLTAQAMAKGIWSTWSQPWPYTAPATTVAGDPRITARCHHDEGSQGADARTVEQVQAGEYDGTQPIKLALRDASILQSFRPDYPWQGSKSQGFVQCGNAVPPLLAAAVIGAVL